ncbi:UdgX family uracil-DNA binding protein [Allosphingosinicella indica]|uniref:Type-4 uracil-DNA glycosylase n=1 Tax=Allosphingosinicella indica TaxID=941907 RepID=A0A1X7FZM1_9SPHN|nr:UdgX family uracil-DNA binding protein [Allosphingosinicella indica]SMF61564.1 DNA polymerase [Allosphingosinicella indica]
MRTVTLTAEDDFDGWRDAARALALAGADPQEVIWQVGGATGDLFADPASAPSAPAGAFSVPRGFVDLASAAILHRDAERFALLYALLCRLRENPKALEDRADPLLRRIEGMAKEVRRDLHKMHAFVRFREMDDGEGGVRYVAWFEPDNHIVRRGAGFFARRFASMAWSILTPELSAHWDGAALSFSPGATRADAPEGDPIEETWKTYYASIFNPARVKVKAMTKEMPKKYWKNMPETALVGGLIAGAQARETEMVARSETKVAAQAAGVVEAKTAERAIEPGGNALKAWEALMEEARGCRRCPLWQPATQTVFGEGPLDAAILFVGEQPGDQEDLAGRPFVGPAGQLFDRALAEAGVDRAATYVSNAVKHFKYEQRGKRRIHSKPNGAEVEACRWWIERERELIRPPVTVALGATAALSLFRKQVTITRMRGQPHVLADGSEAWVTVHPSFLLRIPEEDRKRTEYARFVEDLARIGARAKELAG